MPPSRLFIALLLSPLLMMCGCGEEKVQLEPVKGLITYKNFPLPKGLIVFTPDESRGSDGQLARAEIQPDGSYILKTGDSQGAKPGWYRVTIQAMESPAYAYSGAGYPAPALIPEKYSDPSLSDLTCEVKENQPNNINFNLQ